MEKKIYEQFPPEDPPKNTRYILVPLIQALNYNLPYYPTNNVSHHPVANEIVCPINSPQPVPSNSDTVSSSIDSDKNDKKKYKNLPKGVPVSNAKLFSDFIVGKNEVKEKKLEKEVDHDFLLEHLLYLQKLCKKCYINHNLRVVFLYDKNLLIHNMLEIETIKNATIFLIKNNKNLKKKDIYFEIVHLCISLGKYIGTL